MFAYGTLQPGRLRWPFLERYAVGHRAAVVAGTIYDSGYGWPIARFGDGPGIPGTLVELDPTGWSRRWSCWTRSRPPRPTSSPASSSRPHDGAPAWAYHCAAVPAGAVPIPAWDAVDER